MKRKIAIIGTEHDDREFKARRRLVDAMLEYACARIATPDQCVEVMLLDEDELRMIGDLINGSNPAEFVIEHDAIVAFCKKNHLRVEEPGISGIGSRLVLRHTLIPLPVPVK